MNVQTSELYPRYINKWPGTGGQVNERVPSVITYDERQPLQVSSWGFLSEKEPLLGKIHHEQFKQYLDPARFRSDQTLLNFTQEDVDRWSRLSKVLVWLHREKAPNRAISALDYCGGPIPFHSAN